MVLLSIMRTLLLASFCTALANAYTYPINISSPLSVPEASSWVVPHDFASFSLPAHFFADYAGKCGLNVHISSCKLGADLGLGNNSHPNLFSRDIFDLLYNKTGVHPSIRLGGTST